MEVYIRKIVRKILFLAILVLVLLVIYVIGEEVFGPEVAWYFKRKVRFLKEGQDPSFK